MDHQALIHQSCHYCTTMASVCTQGRLIFEMYTLYNQHCCPFYTHENIPLKWSCESDPFFGVALIDYKHPPQGAVIISNLQGPRKGSGSRDCF